MKLEEVQRDIVRYVFVFDIEYDIKSLNNHISKMEYTCLLNTAEFEIDAIPFDVDRDESIDAIANSSLKYPVTAYSNLAEVWFADDDLPTAEEITLIKDNFNKVAELCEQENVLDEWYPYRRISNARISNLRLVEARTKVEILSEIKLED